MGISILSPWPRWVRWLVERVRPPPPRVKDKAEETNNGDPTKP